MFDLNYYNTIAKTVKYMEDEKGRAYTRENIHKRTAKKGSNKNFWINRINEMPDNEVREYMLSMYNSMGEKGMVQISRDLDVFKRLHQ